MISCFVFHKNSVLTLKYLYLFLQESLDYLAAFFSTLTNQFLHSDDWLEQHDSSLVCCKFLEILSYVFICWTKVLEYKLLVENITQSLLSVPLVHNHSEFFDKSSHGSTLLQVKLIVINIIDLSVCLFCPVYVSCTYITYLYIYRMV